MTDYDFKIGAAFREITDELKNLREIIAELENKIDDNSQMIQRRINSEARYLSGRIEKSEKEIAVLRSNVKEGDNIFADFDEVEENNNE